MRAFWSFIVIGRFFDVRFGLRLRLNLGIHLVEELAIGYFFDFQICDGGGAIALNSN
jgi:hypothetical protein